MYREKYRSFLVFMLTVVCALMYFAYSGNLSDKGADRSVLAENTSKENDSYTVTDDVKMVIPCGTPIGIYVKTDGVMVIDTSEIVSNDGNKYSPCAGIFEQGDYIVSINGNNVEDKNDLIELVEESGGQTLEIGVIRDGSSIEVTATPVLNQKGNYMLGLWVKDDISGIGTLTYIDEDGFGALGHSINDNDTGCAFCISDGAIYDARLVNIVKPSSDSPGRLEGIIDYSAEHIVGRINNNSASGIEGYMTKHGSDTLAGGEWIPVAKKEEAHLGKAYILSSVSGNSEYYEIEITDIDFGDSDGKSLEIKVTDERLLGLTGGIVQGMSGTPIIQDGKLLGAVTHVFLKDSTMGYGVLIESMME